MSIFNDFEQGIIRNSMLSKSYKEIAELIGADDKVVGAYIITLITGTAIITRQMIIDQKKIAQPNKVVTKKVKRISDDKIKEEWQQQKEDKKKTTIAQQSLERKKLTDAWLARKSFKTIKVDTASMISVKVDNKTSILIRKGEDKEEAIKKFFKNRISQKKSEDIY